MTEHVETEPMTPSADGSQVERDDVNVFMLVFVGIFLATGVLLVAVMAQAWFHQWQGDLTAERAMATNDPRTPLGRTVLEQQEQIFGYRWVNRDAGVCGIPVRRAMELVVKEMDEPQTPSKK